MKIARASARWMLVVSALLAAGCARPIGDTDVVFCGGRALCAGKNPAVVDIRVLHQEGSRPRFSPDGDRLVFDRKNPDGYYDVYLTDLEGHTLTPLTDGRPGIPQRNNGNAIFHPSGDYVIFVSEAEDHFADSVKDLGDSGVGLFSNLWATDLRGEHFWRLTDTPIKRNLFDGLPTMASVNPLFSSDGQTVLWTERYAPGGHHNWGLWRIKAADFVVGEDGPRLEDERLFYVPSEGTYVTAMGFLSPTVLVLSGNLDGQHEFGMDVYTLDLPSGELTNLTATPAFWEEDASVTPAGRLVVMTNEFSRYPYDFDDPDWPEQKVEREYVEIDAEGSRQRLTFFNDPGAPEYLGRPVLVAASDVSPDGRRLAATLGVDFGDGRRQVVLKVVLIELGEWP